MQIIDYHIVIKMARPKDLAIVLLILLWNFYKITINLINNF